jgi:hypothetical protein
LSGLGFNKKAQASAAPAVPPQDYAATPKDSEGLVIEFEIPSQNEKGPKRKL